MAGREAVLRRAVEQGRITHDEALRYLPHHDFDEAEPTPRLEGTTSIGALACSVVARAMEQSRREALPAPDDGAVPDDGAKLRIAQLKTILEGVGK